jgi:hypothetical protein
MSEHVAYRHVKVDELSIFYREAGPPEAPTILWSTALPLPHACSTRSSPGFRAAITLLRRLSRLRAQRLAGPRRFEYNLDHCAEIVSDFTEVLGLSR